MRQPRLLRLSDDDLPIPGGIDHRCLAGNVVSDQISIRGYWSKNERNNLQHPLSCSELAVAGIAQSRHDIAALVQMIIDGG